MGALLIASGTRPGVLGGAVDSRAVNRPEDSARVASLDALRGLAAATVVLHHSLVVYPQFWAAYLRDRALSMPVAVLSRTPLHLAWGGLEAVIVFFVLSGYVLSLPFLGPRPPRYLAFATKRCCRIYVPYILSVLVAGVLCARLGGFRVHGLSEWFGRYWNHPATRSSILDHALMLGSPAQNYLNPVVWSLVHELRISLVFPAIILAVTKVRWQILLPSVLIASAAAKLVGRVLSLSGVGSSLLETVSYVFLFVAGAELCLHGVGLRAFCDRLRPGARTCSLAVALLLLGSRSWAPGRWAAVATLAMWAGAIALVAMAAADVGLRRALESGWLVSLGRISYSLYLTHVLVLFSAIRLLQHAIPMPVISALVVPFALATAVGFHWLVELPSIGLGRRLEGRLRQL
jgi:peptidoglycan/LPS O-acetylase OafA/YrhL